MCCQLPETPSTTKKTVDIQTPQTLGVNLPVVNLARIAKGLSQKKDVSPVVVNCYQRELKYVKDVSCVNQLTRFTCRGKTTKLLENLGSSGCRSESTKNS